MEEIVSEGLRLSAHFARPPGVARVPALLVLPGFPRGAGGAAALGNTDATLCDRVAREAGWAGLTFTFRGTGPSEGDFSIDGWLADVRAAVDALDARADVTGVWIAGFRLGGTLAIVTAAGDDRVRGIATFAAPASLRTWVREPEWFLEYARRTGVLRSAGYPADPDAWIRAIANLDPVDAARHVAPRPWLLVHGSADDVVPVDDARRLADAARRERRAADRRQRAAPAASRSPRDRGAARLARPPERLSSHRLHEAPSDRGLRAALLLFGASLEHVGEGLVEAKLRRPTGCGRAASRRRRRAGARRPGARARDRP